MAQASTNAMAYASPTPSMNIPKLRDSNSVGGQRFHAAAVEKHAQAMLTPPDSVSPNLAAHAVQKTVSSPPMINIGNEMEMQDVVEHGTVDNQPDPQVQPSATPLSKGALSGLDASAVITPAMLAKHHLPGIMLGHGPKPIRYVMGELTHSVPGFSRIPPAKARRLVVAALENRSGGGVDGNVAFCKTGWGRWDAHFKVSSKDSAIGSFNEGHMSPPRSEHGSYAHSFSESGVHMPAPRQMAGYRDQHSGGSWTASSLREEDELDMDMDVPEDEADKMSLDERNLDDESSETSDSATEDEDWAAVGMAALRKASLPPPDAPRKNYNALAIPITTRWPSRSYSRRPSGLSIPDRPFQSSSLPHGNNLDPAFATPEERDAVAALMKMGSM
ncbi:hypothetical protein MBLNU230_g0160t1 [Neophaeotheca triangularis]